MNEPPCRLSKEKGNACVVSRPPSACPRPHKTQARSRFLMQRPAGTRFRISITRRLTARDDVAKRTVKLFV